MTLNHAQGAAPGCPLCWVLRCRHTLRWWVRECRQTLSALFCSHQHERVMIEGQWVWYECLDCLQHTPPVHYPMHRSFGRPRPLVRRHG